MNLKAPVLALLVPCAMLAACNRADTTAENEVMNDSAAPAAATGFDGVGQPTGTTDLDATIVSPPVNGELSEGAAVNAGEGTVSPMDESRASSNAAGEGAAVDLPLTPDPEAAQGDDSGHPKRPAD